MNATEITPLEPGELNLGGPAWRAAEAEGFDMSLIITALRMPVGEHWIAAPTAAVLYQFRELCITGLPTRVAHFEQPLFARK